MTISAADIRDFGVTADGDWTAALDRQTTRAKRSFQKPVELDGQYALSLDAADAVLTVVAPIEGKAGRWAHITAVKESGDFGKPSRDAAELALMIGQREEPMESNIGAKESRARQLCLNIADTLASKFAPGEPQRRHALRLANKLRKAGSTGTGIPGYIWRDA